ncbi:MAG TPA: response regulator transcription factor [Anaerolineae bacterium]|nr:response regulator transcription factor [Anaerolineae bacterium]HMR68254.1 response regulator transcription factor [Anaerolineae bacterium]
MSDKITVILAEDHPLVRRGLVSMLKLEPDIEVIGEADNGRQATDLVLALEPDVVLMDLQMPQMGGVEAVKEIRASLPQARIIILTTFGDDENIYEAIAAGARGYILKDAPPDDIIEAIRAAHRGESLLTPSVAARLLDQFSNLAQRSTQKSNEPQVTANSPKLTARELEVLRLLAKGARNREIAESLYIVERTVKIHVGNIMNKLNANNRTEVVAMAIKLGLLKE